MYIEKLASQIRNDVVSGLRGYHTNLSLNMKQLEDEIVSCRLAILKEHMLKGVFPIKDLLIAINCIDVDCQSLERCSCREFSDDTLVAHFEIPQLISDYGKQAIEYIGSTDRQNKFTVITSLSELKNKKYRKRGKDKPYVWIDFAPNTNGMLDCFLFNAPFLEQVSIVGVFKDPRQLEEFGCCSELESDNYSWINNEITYRDSYVLSTEYVINEQNVTIQKQNDILDESGKVSWSKCQGKVNTLLFIYHKDGVFPNRFWGQEDNLSDNDKNKKIPCTLIINYADPVKNAKHGGILDKLQCKGQGSSAMRYLIWNVNSSLNKFKYSVTDPETGEEVKPILYFDEESNEVKGKCKLKPYKKYFAFEIRENNK